MSVYLDSVKNSKEGRNKFRNIIQATESLICLILVCISGMCQNLREDEESSWALLKGFKSIHIFSVFMGGGLLIKKEKKVKSVA